MPLRVGDVALVYDLGTTFEAAVIRVGDDLPEIIGHASIVDLLEEDSALLANRSPAAIELTMACCRDLLARVALGQQQIDWVLPVGFGARTPALPAALDRGLGIAVALVDEPELAVVRGAAQWLPRSGPRTVMARPSAERMVPLIFTIPGGPAQLLRWLVEPGLAYDIGVAVARVRLGSSAVWDLTARSRRHRGRGAGRQRPSHLHRRLARPRSPTLRPSARIPFRAPPSGPSSVARNERSDAGRRWVKSPEPARVASVRMSA